MTTHNGAPFIAESLDSILAQRFGDFELVVVDDASTDETPALLATYAARDTRLRILRPRHNLGVVGARNYGFAACRGEYIAALDHDDLSHSDRLALQVAYLDTAPRVVLVGTEVLLIKDQKIRVTDHRSAASPLQLRWMLHIDNPLTWSSVMIRTAALRRVGVFMRADAEYADDFDLYHRLLAIGDIARLDTVLTTYRWHARNTTLRNGEVLANHAAQVLATAYRGWLGKASDAAAILIIRHLSDRQPPADLTTLARLGGWLEQLLAGFCAEHATAPMERAAIEAHAAGVWWRVVRSAVRSGSPGAVRQRWAWPGLYHAAQPSVADLLGSFAIGALRASPTTRRLLDALRGGGQ